MKKKDKQKLDAMTKKLMSYKVPVSKPVKKTK